MYSRKVVKAHFGINRGPSSFLKIGKIILLTITFENLKQATQHLYHIKTGKVIKKVFMKDLLCINLYFSFLFIFLI